MIDAVEITIERGSVRGHAKGEPFSAQFFDRADQQFYAGSGRTAFEAVAWALVERVERRASGNRPTVARNDSDTPESALARLVAISPLVADKAESAHTGTAPGTQIRVGTAEPTSSARNSGDSRDRPALRDPIGCTGVTQIRPRPEPIAALLEGAKLEPAPARSYGLASGFALEAGTPQPKPKSAAARRSKAKRNG